MIDDAHKLDVTDLVRMFEESERATEDARREAEIDRDYYDGNSITAEMRAEMRKRRQPEVSVNKVKQKVDFYIGLEPNQRQAPKGLPRTPRHEGDADSVTDAMRFVIESEDYYQTRAFAWRDLLREGIGAIEVALEQRPTVIETPYGNMPTEEVCVTFRPVSWDRYFYDPASSRDDFEDVGYHGVVKWMDLADAIAQYPDHADDLNQTMAESVSSDTYDDKPRYTLWIDSKRKRVRVCQIWVQKAGKWWFAEYTKTVILKGGPSPFEDDKGQSLCGLIAASAYTDRNNQRYGVIRQLRPLQDAMNKSLSKILHVLATSQIVMEEGAVENVEKTRIEAARPDGVIVRKPGMEFEFNMRGDISTGHMGLLSTLSQEFDLMGPNASMMGNDGESASGRAIIASQQGGMTQMGDLLDKLRFFDKRVYRLVWAAVRKFWTAPKWVRVTDDESNVRFVGLNQPGQAPIASLEVDVIMDDSPASLTPALEQFNALTGLAQAGVPIPPEVIIEAAPNLRNKGKLLEKLAQAQQQAAQGQPDPMQIEQAKMEMQMQAKQAEAQIKRDEAMASIELKRMEAQMAREAKMAEAQMNAEFRRAEMAEKLEFMREENQIRLAASADRAAQANTFRAE